MLNWTVYPLRTVRRTLEDVPYVIAAMAVEE